MKPEPAGAPPPLPFTRTLKSGTTVLLRYLEPSDREELRKGFLRLSTLSRWLRFASPIRRLTEGQLRYLTEVDQVDHVAVGVRDEGHPDKPGVAVARCIRLKRGADVAEFAITVVDDYQDQGIGSLLLRVLMAAAGERGIRVLRGYVQGTNTRMLHVLERVGARLQPRTGGMIEAEIDLPDGAAVAAEASRGSSGASPPGSPGTEPSSRQPPAT
ncbi:MAG: GNAT family N-acetyltransferase [Spirochaetales bacterium]|nr:GNAT family N-acetyltransferase [Spirochaetales bacterium]